MRQADAVAVHSEPLQAALADADRVVVLGDLHGDVVAFRLLVERAVQEMRLTRLLVSVGDFGIGPWPAENQDKVLRRADDLLDEAGAFLLLTPGNHENWDTLDQAAAQRSDGLGFAVLGRHGRVRVSPRGHRFQVGGLAFGSLGGAVSVDQSHRRAGSSWWPQEAPREADLVRLGDQRLDVLVTHDVPAGVPLVSDGRWAPALIAQSDNVRALLAQAVINTRPTVVFAGHWHQRLTHDLIRGDGGTTRVEVLSEEHTTGNAISLDLLTLAVTGLPDLWHRHLTWEQT